MITQSETACKMESWRQIHEVGSFAITSHDCRASTNIENTLSDPEQSFLRASARLVPNIGSFEPDSVLSNRSDLHTLNNTSCSHDQCWSHNPCDRDRILIPYLFLFRSLGVKRGCEPVDSAARVTAEIGAAFRSVSRDRISQLPPRAPPQTTTHLFRRPSSRFHLARYRIDISYRVFIRR